MRQHIRLRHVGLVLLSAVPLLVGSQAAFGQQTSEPSLGYMVRVTVAEASIFAQADARSPLVGRVRSGDTLVVTGKTNAWYKVRIPRDRRLTPTGPASGYIDAKSVVVAGPGSAIGPATTGRPGAAAAAPTGGAVGWSALRVRLFGNVAYQSFAATDSFKAIFGTATGVLYGGGIDLVIGRSLGLSVGATHFQKTGERAFAFNGEAFPLGISEKVSITPFDVNVTYRFLKARRYIPYVGGGVGAVLYRETSDSAQAGDNVDKTGTAFQVLGGVEIPVVRHLSVAVEGQYQGIRGILGEAGVSQAFSENDLGGASVRFRLIVGR